MLMKSLCSLHPWQLIEKAQAVFQLLRAQEEESSSDEGEEEEDESGDDE